MFQAILRLMDHLLVFHLDLSQLFLLVLLRLTDRPLVSHLDHLQLFHPDLLRLTDFLLLPPSLRQLILLDLSTQQLQYHLLVSLLMCLRLVSLPSNLLHLRQVPPHLPSRLVTSLLVLLLTRLRVLLCVPLQSAHWLPSSLLIVH